jgi:hypothetical protein
VTQPVRAVRTPPTPPPPPPPPPPMSLNRITHPLPLKISTLWNGCSALSAQHSSPPCANCGPELVCHSIPLSTLVLLVLMQVLLRSSTVPINHRLIISQTSHQPPRTLSLKLLSPRSPLLNEPAVCSAEDTSKVRDAVLVSSRG